MRGQMIRLFGQFRSMPQNGDWQTAIASGIYRGKRLDQPEMAWADVAGLIITVSGLKP
ncbi:hypothetical protein BN1221_00772c [Brenneria goodwinii]|uniref:Uncharacterized protein n=1 Tax=Brenneria goodwinii TaxID=1109412 RepID=A0A0G4JR06_9GAMM|nr:hypothetical protein BN1221_00772c [Brenneria goodwinii]